MLRLAFATEAQKESVHELLCILVDGTFQQYTIHIVSVSPWSSILSFKVGPVPECFSMSVSTPKGPVMIHPFQGEFYALNHNHNHSLTFLPTNKPVLSISPPPLVRHIPGAPIIKKLKRTHDESEPNSNLLSSSSSDSHASVSEEEEHRTMREYILEEWGNCNALRAKIEWEGAGYFYSNYTTVPVSWTTYDDFVESSYCWCDQCK